MAQLFPTSAQVIYDTLAADATFTALLGSYTLKTGQGPFLALSIVSPGEDLPSLKEVEGVECVIQDVGNMRQRKYLTSPMDVETEWSLFLMTWDPSVGNDLHSATKRVLERFHGAKSLQTIATPDGLGSTVQTKIIISSENPVIPLQLLLEEQDNGPQKVRGTFVRIQVRFFYMANFSAAFGYDLYLIPLKAESVDVSFASVTGGVGAGAGNFVDTTTVIAQDEKITYSAGVFSIGATPVAEPTDGTMQPVRLYGLTSASLETDTGSEDIYTYDDETKGFNQAVATTKSWSMSLAGVADFKDAGYQILRLTEQNTVADSLRVKIARVGPTGTVETVYGYGTLMGYTESNEVSSIVSWECSLTGYGSYVVELDENAGNQLNGGSTGGIGSSGAITTTTPFDEVSSSTVDATFSAPSGGGTTAIGTVVTDGSGNVIGYSLSNAGDGYAVGETVSVNETSGAGVATFELQSVF